jgi:hypothetical protein
LRSQSKSLINNDSIVCKSSEKHLPRKETRKSLDDLTKQPFLLANSGYYSWKTIDKKTILQNSDIFMRPLPPVPIELKEKVVNASANQNMVNNTDELSGIGYLFGKAMDFIEYATTPYDIQVLIQQRGINSRAEKTNFYEISNENLTTQDVLNKELIHKARNPKKMGTRKTKPLPQPKKEPNFNSIFSILNCKFLLMKHMTKKKPLLYEERRNDDTLYNLNIIILLKTIRVF